MEDFQDLEEAYLFIEESTDGKVENHNFTTSLKKLLDNTTDEECKKKTQWEIDCFGFMLQDGEAKPFISSTKEDGNEYGYPSYDSYTEDTYKYWVWRSEQVTNPLLIIRYNQVLWNGKGRGAKNQRFAKKAADIYYELLNKELKNLDSEGQYYFIDLFRNGFTLSSKISYRNSEYKALWGKLVFEREPIKDLWKSRLIDFALENRKFKKDDFKGVVDLCLNIIHQETQGRDLWDNEQILETALKVGKRTSKDLAPIHIEMGRNYEASAEHRMNDDSRMIPLTFLNQALEHYQEAKNQSKIEEVAVRIAELRQELKLTSVPINFNQEQVGPLIDYVRNKAKQILTSEPEAIYSYIASGEDFSIFPKKEWMEKSAKETTNESSIYDLFSTNYVDINNNQSKADQSEDGKLTKKIYEKYDMYAKIILSPFLQTLFVEGIKSGRLSHHNFAQFVVKHSWLGQNFSERSGGGELREYNWISAISPAIQEYFFNTKAAIFGSHYQPNYLLAIDSLTLKFEGILRNFAHLIGVQTIRYSQKGQGTREMYMEEILENPKVQNFFNEDDRILFKYVLLGYGMNLRNNIAHCFFKYPDYNYRQMHLLILCILRLGKYYLEPSAD